MSVIGESISRDVDNQIKIRQDLQGKQTRTNTDINLLNNTNAWLKLASSVRVISQTDAEIEKSKDECQEKVESTPTYNSTTGKYEEEESNISSGEQRLRDIGLDNTSKYTGNQLAKKAVLFNTLSELDSSGNKYISRSGVSKTNSLWNSNSYGLGGTSFGPVPAPGLISAKINCLNRGSIREATVELKAYNLFQFELIELLYLRLGYTMLLEWGWDKFLNNDNTPESMGNTLTEDSWFQDISTDSYRKVIDRIAKYRVDYSNNYDGFLGKVVNFDWSFQPDGTYNITLKLITIGDVIESLKVNLPAELTVLSQIQNLTDEKDSIQSELLKLDSPIITNAGSSTFSLSLFKDISEYTMEKWAKSQSKYFSWFLNANEGEFLKNDFTVFTDDQAENKSKNQFPPTGTESNKYTYFMTFDELLNKLNNLCVPSINEDKILEFDTGESNICSVFPNQVSFNPKICLIKPAYTSNINISSKDQVIDNGIKNYYNSFAKLRDFVISEPGNNISYGKIMNIYINYDFISNTLQKNTGKDGEISIYKFLEDICDGINSSLGGLNKLEPVIEDDNIVKIIDQNPIPGIENSAEFGCLFAEDNTSFEIFGYSPSGSSTSNFVRDFGFKTKIGPELASMITIGAVAQNKSTKNYDGTAFSKWNSGLKDAYAATYDDPTTETISQEFDPFTGDQVNKLYNKFISSSEDTHYGTDFLRAGGIRPVKTTGAYGIKNVRGTKDIDNSPITFKDYDNVTWAGYMMRAASDYRKSLLQLQKQRARTNQNVISSYFGWLIKAFGGKINKKPYLSNKNKLYFYLNDDFYKIGKELFKAFITGLNNEIYNVENNPSNIVGFIPADLSLTIDGLAGIKIYNALSINQRFLPKQYPSALKFIITKVNHNISDNNWDTGLSTISIPNVIPPNIDFFLEALGNVLETEILSSIIAAIPLRETEQYNELTRKSISTLTTSEAEISNIKTVEGFKANAYDDKQPNVVLTASTPILGTLTIGYGFTSKVIADLKWDSTITEPQADTTLRNSIKNTFEVLVKNVISVPLRQEEFDALVSITYNSGVIDNTSDGNPTPLQNTINNKEYRQAAEIIPKYRITAVGFVGNVPGLITRRNKERGTYLGGYVYDGGSSEPSLGQSALAAGIT